MGPGFGSPPLRFAKARYGNGPSHFAPGPALAKRRPGWDISGDVFSWQHPLPCLFLYFFASRLWKRTACEPGLLGAAARLRRQPFSSLEPAAGQYVAAVGSLHTLTEAVDLFPLALFGLVGLKHGSCTSFPFGNDNLARERRAIKPLVSAGAG